MVHTTAMHVGKFAYLFQIVVVPRGLVSYVLLFEHKIFHSLKSIIKSYLT